MPRPNENDPKYRDIKDWAIRREVYEDDMETYRATEWKPEIMALMQESGATRAVVGFSGGGDEGSIDDIVVFNGDQHIEGSDDLNARLERLDDDFDVIDYNGEGIAGNIVVDAVNNSITLEYEEEEWVKQTPIII